MGSGDRRVYRASRRRREIDVQIAILGLHFLPPSLVNWWHRRPLSDQLGALTSRVRTGEGARPRLRTGSGRLWQGRV